MAQIIGESEAWHSVQLRLESRSIRNVHSPEDLRNCIKNREEELRSWEHHGHDHFEQYIVDFKYQLDSLYKSTKSEIAQQKKRTSRQIASYKKKLSVLEQEKNILKRIFSVRERRRLKRQIKSAQANYKAFVHGKRQAFHQKLTAYKTIKGDPDTFIQGKVKSLKREISFLRDVRNSPDFAGAVAELELIAELQSLPDGYHVFNDVRLQAKKAIRFDDAWLKSAQIDHLVVAPTRLFVIETKNWSKEFASDGDFFDPYQQVKRAGYLCYKIIGQPHGVKVQTILAYKHHLPETEQDTFTKVLRLGAVKDYIYWFEENDSPMDESQTRAIITKLNQLT